MKKILLATSALVAYAGAASAEVSISGWAEMGVYMYDSGQDNGSDWKFHDDLDVSFDLRGEANGLEFGADIDLDEAGALGGDGSGGAAAVFVSGKYGTLTLGDTDGAFDKAMQEIAVGTTMTDVGEIGFNGFPSGSSSKYEIDQSTGTIVLTSDADSDIWGAGNSGFDGLYDNQILRYDFAYAGLTGSFSAEIPDGSDADTIWALGINYSGEIANFGYDLGVGYQKAGNINNSGGDGDIWGVSVGTDVAGFGLILNYSEGSLDKSVLGVVNDEERKTLGVSATYTIAGFNVGANYVSVDHDSNTNFSQDAYSIFADYEVGEGIVATASYGKRDYDDKTLSDIDTAEIGLVMSF